MTKPKEPTREEMLLLFDCGWSGNDYMHPCEHKLCSEYKNGRCVQVRAMVRRLIENRPMVNGKWINELANNLMMAVPKAKGKGVAVTLLHGAVVNEIRQVLGEAGVEAEDD